MENTRRSTILALTATRCQPALRMTATQRRFIMRSRYCYLLLRTIRLIPLTKASLQSSPNRGIIMMREVPMYLATKIGSEVVYFDKQVFNAS